MLRAERERSHRVRSIASATAPSTGHASISVCTACPQLHRPALWGELRATFPTLLDGIPTPGRSIDWDEIDVAVMPVFGGTNIIDLPPMPAFDLAEGALRAEAAQQVTFTDTDNDRSTLKLTGAQLSWHDAESDECFLRPITRLTYRAADATLIAPERAELLVSRLLVPAEGADRDALLAEIVRMANAAGVELEGF